MRMIQKDPCKRIVATHFMVNNWSDQFEEIKRDIT